MTNARITAQTGDRWDAIDRTTPDGIYRHGIGVAAVLSAAGYDAAYEHPGFIAVYLPDGRYVATGLNGWDYADVCSADGDSLYDESTLINLPADGTDSITDTARAIADAIARIGGAS